MIVAATKVLFQLRGEEKIETTAAAKGWAPYND